MDGRNPRERGGSRAGDGAGCRRSREGSGRRRGQDRHGWERLTSLELVELFRQQQAGGFADLAGARAAAFIPVSDRLLNDVLARSLPADAPVRDLRVEARPGNAFDVRVRLARPAFVPSFTIRLVIERQPQFPLSPVLVLRIASGGLMALAGPALRLFAVLPAGITLVQDRIEVDVRALLRSRGFAFVVPYVEELQITTAPPATIVSLRAGLSAAETRLEPTASAAPS